MSDEEPEWDRGMLILHERFLMRCRIATLLTKMSTDGLVAERAKIALSAHSLEATALVMDLVDRELARRRA
jgi:hypothetical protein